MNTDWCCLNYSILSISDSFLILLANKHQFSQITKKNNYKLINIVALVILNKKEKQTGRRRWVAILGKCQDEVFVAFY